MTPLALPTPADTGLHGDQVCHFFDCDPNLAWCGEDITHQPVVPEDTDEPECPLCLLADELGEWACCGGAQ